MKKIVTILAALLLLSVSASAQLSIGGKSEGSKRLATLQAEWVWLYQSSGHYYYVSATTNQFDDPIWLDLGQTREEAAGTIQSLRDALADAKKGDQIEITSEGQTFALGCDVVLGTRCFWIHARKTRKTYAGMGQMTDASLRKGYNYLTK